MMSRNSFLLDINVKWILNRSFCYDLASRKHKVMLKVTNSGALQFQPFQRPMYMVLTGIMGTPASST
jgi:hypothetical protein